MASYVSGDVNVGGPQNGVDVYLWAASRFTAQPAQGAATPSGTADYGPVVTGTAFGGPGQWTFSAVADGDYYAQAVYGGTNYWAGPFAALEFGDVVGTSSVQTISGNKTLSGTTSISGTLTTTHGTTLEDGAGNVTVGTNLSVDGASTTQPAVTLPNAPTAAVTFGTNYGMGRGHNNELALNAPVGGVKFLSGATLLGSIDGSGNLIAEGTVTASTGLTLTSGVVNVPNGSIPAAAVQGLSGASAGVTIGTSQSITGQKTFLNNVPLVGSQLVGTAMATPGAPTVTPTPAGGVTTYNYAVVETTYDGRDTLVGATGATTTGPATLSGTAYNTVTPTLSGNQASWKLLKSVSGVWQLVAAGISATSYNDIGTATTAYTAATVNPGGEVAFGGRMRIGDIGAGLQLGELFGTDGGGCMSVQGTGAVSTGTTSSTGAFTTRNTLDDGNGNLIAKGNLNVSSSQTVLPAIHFTAAAGGVPAYGANAGIGVDQSSHIILNSAGSTYTQVNGVTSNILDDGAGNIHSAANFYSGGQNSYVPAVIGARGSYGGTPPAVSVEVFKEQSASDVVTLNASGQAYITFPVPFAGGVVTILITNGDTTAQPSVFLGVGGSSVTLSGFVVQGSTITAGVNPTGATRVNWIAKGW